MIRSLVLSRRWLALWLIAAALAVKAIVPAGYMVAPGKSFTVTMCSGTGAGEMTLTVPMSQDGKGKHDSTDKPADGTCAFSALGFAAMGGADLALLVAVITWLIALGVGPVVLPSLARIPHRSPPLRGPPAFA